MNNSVFLEFIDPKPAPNQPGRRANDSMLAGHTAQALEVGDDDYVELTDRSLAGHVHGTTHVAAVVPSAFEVFVAAGPGETTPAFRKSGPTACSPPLCRDGIAGSNCLLRDVTDPASCSGFTEAPGSRRRTPTAGFAERSNVDPAPAAACNGTAQQSNGEMLQPPCFQVLHLPTKVRCERFDRQIASLPQGRRKEA